MEGHIVGYLKFIPAEQQHVQAFVDDESSRYLVDLVDLVDEHGQLSVPGVGDLAMTRGRNGVHVGDRVRHRRGIGFGLGPGFGLRRGLGWPRAWGMSVGGEIGRRVADGGVEVGHGAGGVDIRGVFDRGVAEVGLRRGVPLHRAWDLDVGGEIFRRVADAGVGVGHMVGGVDVRGEFGRGVADADVGRRVGSVAGGGDHDLFDMFKKVVGVVAPIVNIGIISFTAYYTGVSAATIISNGMNQIGQQIGQNFYNSVKEFANEFSIWRFPSRAAPPPRVERLPPRNYFMPL